MGLLGKSPWDDAGRLVASIIPLFRGLNIGTPGTPINKIYTESFVATEANMAVTAAGATFAAATQLDNTVNNISVAAAGTGVKLPDWTDVPVTVINSGLNPVLVYAHVITGTIDGVLTFTIPVGASATFLRSGTSTWITANAVTEGITSIATGLTAAGTTIADALVLTAYKNILTTVAAASGAQLWAIPVGSSLTVTNRGLNAVLVYPHDAAAVINDELAGAAVSLAVGQKLYAERISDLAWDAGVMADI